MKIGITCYPLIGGSGILAIAAGKLGAGRVVGTDIDPNALEASQRNALENAVAVEFVPPDALHNDRFDVVVANILANPSAFSETAVQECKSKQH
jgi:ribosomal protein L11 methyltransferase